MKTYRVVENTITKKFDVVDEADTVVKSELERAAADAAANNLNTQEKSRTAKP
jgi:hypothetical protein